MKVKRLGDILVESGQLTEQDIQKALQLQKQSNKRLGEVLIANGIITLQGGEIDNEIAPFRKYAEIEELSTWTDNDWFKEKHLIYLPI